MKKEIRIKAGDLNKTSSPFLRFVVLLVLLVLLFNNIVNVLITRTN